MSNCDHHHHHHHHHHHYQDHPSNAVTVRSKTSAEAPPEALQARGPPSEVPDEQLRKMKSSNIDFGPLVIVYRVEVSPVREEVQTKIEIVECSRISKLKGRNVRDLIAGHRSCGGSGRLLSLGKVLSDQFRHRVNPLFYKGSLNATSSSYHKIRGPCL